MEMTFTDLQKMALPKLKEYALSIGNIHGVHSMKKQDLIEEICKIKGIVDTSKVEAEKRRKQAQSDIRALKKQAREIRGERTDKKGELSRKELSTYRKRIKQLKRKTRKLAVGA